MTLTTLGPATLLTGLAALATTLFLLQRLRVRHRELEVVTTLFWREAVEERRVWVFWRRFRHVWAYLLLLAIASLIWLLIAGPALRGTGGRRHVVLLDGSASMSRDDRFALAAAAARDLAKRLPADRREVRLVAGTVDTVLGRGEPAPLLDARLRARTPAAAPGGLEAALRAVVATATDTSPVNVYLVGDAPVRSDFLSTLPDTVTVSRAPLAGVATANRGIVNLGLAESARGAWRTVDVLFEVAPVSTPIAAETLAVSVDGVRVDQPLERGGDGVFVVRNVPATGGVLTVGFVDPAFGGSITQDDTASIRLPRRPPIVVWIDDDAPPALRDVLELDPAVRISSSRADAEVAIAADAEADFRLADEGPDASFIVRLDRAYRIGAEEDLVTLIDALAIRQIDAASLAEQTRREVRLDVERGDSRQIAVWRPLLEAPYDFRDSRAFPVFVARSVRWLAGRPELMPWARADEPLLVSAPLVGRPARAGERSLADGRTVPVALLERDGGAAAADADDTLVPGEGRGLDLFGLIGLLAAAALIAEWTFYQRGRIP
jgi:hypothetical protein